MKQIFTFLRFVQNAKTVMLVPICKTVSVSSRLLKFYEPINSQGKPTVGMKCEVTSKDSKVKFNQATSHAS